MYEEAEEGGQQSQTQQQQHNGNGTMARSPSTPNAAAAGSSSAGAAAAAANGSAYRVTLGSPSPGVTSRRNTGERSGGGGYAVATKGGASLEMVEGASLLGGTKGDGRVTRTGVTGATRGVALEVTAEDAMEEGDHVALLNSGTLKVRRRGGGLGAHLGHTRGELDECVGRGGGGGIGGEALQSILFEDHAIPVMSKPP